MNRAEKYVYRVYQTKSFSAAANELFVSQPALSIAIKNLEEELGYEIFNRKKSPVTLTVEGEFYIEYLEESMEIERNLRERISSLHNIPSEKLSVGGSNSAALHILPKICGEFYRRFPNVSLTLDIGNKPLDRLSQGSVDLVVNTNCDFSKFDAVKLWDEKYVVVVKNDYPGVEALKKYVLSYEEALSGKFPQSKEITDLKLFKSIKFFKPGPNSNARKKMPKVMEQCAGTSCKVANFPTMDFCYKLMLEGLGAVIVPQITLLENPYEKDNLYYFSLDIENNTRQAMIVYRKDIPLSTPTQNFISIAREMYETREKLFNQQRKP